MREYAVCDVISNKMISENIYDMQVKFDKDLSGARAGQFAQLFVQRGENLLPRPISLCEIDKENGLLRLIYQVVGKGTEYFSALTKGDKLTMLAPLGNGYNIFPSKKNIAIIGGGVGVPPMLQLTKDVREKNPDAEVSVFLGFRSAPYLVKDFAQTGARVHIATDDGSLGFKGNVIALMDSIGYSNCDIVYACGPKIMLKFVSQWAEKHQTQCFVSMEQRMACGLGVCVGCAIPVKKKKSDEIYYKKVCKEGPVFLSTEVIWDEQ